MAKTPYGAVVIPGIGGTTLSYRGGFGGSTKYWYNPTIMASRSPLSMALAADGVSPYPVLGKDLFPAGPVDMGIYEPLITALANGGYNPVFWGYDWRLSVDVSAAALAKYLASENLTNPFSLVCHSMGGLIAQLAYPLYLAAPGTGTWRSTVYLGTPHGGSHWAAAALAGWYPKGSELAVLSSVFDLIFPSFFSIGNRVVKLANLLVQQMVQSWPSVYCLLPSSLGPWAGLDPNAPLLLDESTYRDSQQEPSAAWLANALRIQGVIANGLGQPRPPETPIYGLGFTTLEGYKDDNRNPLFQSAYTTTLVGDGTVTEDRAQLGSGIKSVGIIGDGHLEIVRSAQGTTAVLAALASPPGASTQQAFIPPSTIEILSPPPTLSPIVSNPYANKTGDP